MSSLVVSDSTRKALTLLALVPVAVLVSRTSIARHVCALVLNNLTSKSPKSRTFAAIDAANACDPREDEGEPKELLYGKRMSEMQGTFKPDANDLVQIACRAQHIERWTSPRTTYPAGKLGYLKWRSDLYVYHGTRAAEIMYVCGYAQSDCARVQYLLSKKGIKAADASDRDVDAQIVEDVACLVFLKYYWKPFMKSEVLSDDKLVAVLQRTWSKMSDDAHAAALDLGLNDDEMRLIKIALS
ncbi:hypothetical protein SARC_02834 [Sphaeroforma arctica JP610]|uniref:Uncharacterized protein n=1 Tax=Sphaeroforma arctica JP610 TaxID=667725 RepID=A0A0L0G7S6_9EUKA|nr:hypothetical protein SARC_02834 [Sphaeroforma arctica JP610]KNC84979.1 hypothetical protein SARC_02834 [Sphaeroforma arctica JP610]|eukprot:XP_014158881.1 hypothetical protein SARC_02834 [Sphaeroforma arctica JP610]